MVIINSTGRRRYVPHPYGRYLWPRDGTIIRNRSSHIPTQTPADAMTHPPIVRSFLMLRIATGTTKLHVTIVQKSGAKVPFWVTQNTATSASSLPYQVV